MKDSRLIFDARSGKLTHPSIQQPHQGSTSRMTPVDRPLYISFPDNIDEILFYISKLAGVQQLVTEQIKQHKRIRADHLEALRDEAATLANVCHEIIEDSLED